MLLPLYLFATIFAESHIDFCIFSNDLNDLNRAHLLSFKYFDLSVNNGWRKSYSIFKHYAFCLYLLGSFFSLSLKTVFNFIKHMPFVTYHFSSTSITFPTWLVIDLLQLQFFILYLVSFCFFSLSFSLVVFSISLIHIEHKPAWWTANFAFLFAFPSDSEFKWTS